MYIIQDILVHEDLFQEYFQCNLTACKGACCVEGEFGAPLEKEEITILDSILPDVLPFLDPEGIVVIQEKGTNDMYEDEDHTFPGTILRKDGACAFLRTDNNGIALCGLESAYRAGATDFKKPVSCELYPIRITEVPEQNFTAINYDRWEICNPACSKGKKSGIRLYQFVKDALIRKYNEQFYNELDRAAQHFLQTKQKEDSSEQ